MLTLEELDCDGIDLDEEWETDNDDELVPARPSAHDPIIAAPLMTSTRTRKCISVRRDESEELVALFEARHAARRAGFDAFAAKWAAHAEAEVKTTRRRTKKSGKTKR